MGADHVETITAAISGAEIRGAVADIDLKRAGMIASRVPGAKACPAEELITSRDVDGVIIASSNALRCPQA